MKILQWISCNYYQLSSFFSVIQFLGEILTNCCIQLCNATDQSDHHQVVLDFGLANVKANAHGALIAFSPDLRGSHCWQVSITTTSIWNFYGNLLFNCLDFPFADPTAATLIFMVKKLQPYHQRTPCSCPHNPSNQEDNISADYQDSRTGQDQKFNIRDHNYKDDNLFVGFLFLPVAVIVLP